jgi:hypothetical protein
VTDAAGNPVDWPGLDFFVYAGDATGDRTVDFADLVPLAQNYNTAGKTYDQGDFDYDGDVDFADLVILAHHYNTTLPPPAAPAPAVATSPVQNSRRSPTAEPSALVFSTKPVAKPASKPRLVSKPPRR